MLAQVPNKFMASARAAWAILVRHLRPSPSEGYDEEGEFAPGHTATTRLSRDGVLRATSLRGLVPSPWVPDRWL